MVAQRNATRPTREQILFGLRECFAHWIPEQRLIDPEADFPSFVLKHGIDWSEPGWTVWLEGVEPIQEYFGFEVTDLGWDRLFSYGEQSGCALTTFAQVADFIAEQLDLTISFEPAVVFGRTCQPAGVFLGLEELATQVNPKVEKFGPSTPIRSRLRGSSLIKYIKLLNWLTKGCSPKASDPLAFGTMCRRAWDFFALPIGLVSFACVALGISKVMPDIGNSLPVFLITGLLSVVLFFAWMIFVHYAGVLLTRSFVNPLPAGVTSFRDLAKLIASRMEANSNTASQTTQVAR